VKIRAPAKINLTLRVVGRRADGYHLLDTVMVPVSLYDDIDIRKVRVTKKTRETDRPLIKVICSNPAVPNGRGNLVYRAAELLLAKAKIKQPIEIRIRKRIPVGAGLGGGSSDAAATLNGLNRLFKLSLSAKTLERLGLTLGTDVPFFVRGRPARARGIGERLQPLHGLPAMSAVLVYPGFAVSTAWVYRNLPRKLTIPDLNNSILLRLKDVGDLGALMVNDLEIITLNRYPKIAIIKEKLLRAGAAACLMSGSGSSVFGIFHSNRKARVAFRMIAAEEDGTKAFLVKCLTLAPKVKS
jgi:4-diphosphocytidyl-2-C-methyl-D-erythritol kinase